jgi:hypothetical protein
MAFLGSRDDERVDHSRSVAGRSRMLDRAGFALIDVLLRDADQPGIDGRKSLRGVGGVSSRSAHEIHVALAIQASPREAR